MRKTIVWSEIRKRHEGRLEPWPIRSALARAAGPAVMTLAHATERRLGRRRRGPLDYDEALVSGKIVASIMHLGATPHEGAALAVPVAQTTGHDDAGRRT